MPYPATASLLPHEKDGVLWYTFRLFAPFAGRFLHAISTRIGGVSKGGLAELNLGLSRGDALENVYENYARLGAAVGFDWQRVVLAQQTHSTNICEAEAHMAGMGVLRERSYRDVDGWLVRQANLPVMTQHADCTPLVLYAADTEMAVTAHAGWRGTVQDMAGAAVRALSARGADPAAIFAAIGPSAAACCYEVGEPVAAHFRALSDTNGPALYEREGRLFADLWRANQLLLQRAGVPAAQIEIGGLCTICQADTFYSHRVQGAERGAFASLVMLRP